MGEVNAAAPLIKQLLKTYPELSLVVTNSTPTGAQQVEKLFAGQVIQLMAPLDSWDASRRFSQALQPRLSLFTEVEIWPNWLASIKSTGATLILINARLSENSLRSYQKFATLFKPALACFDVIAAQNKTYQARYQAFNRNIQICGNLKFDIQLDERLPEQIIQLHSQHHLKRKIWIAASVHPGEYEIIIAAHQKILQQFPDALLIVAPRHSERFVQVAQYLKKESHFNFVLRSQASTVEAHTQVWLLDSLGELMQFYALADIAFVGGSLVNRGGHNPLEPAALGKPILMGPKQNNCADMCATLAAAGAFKTVSDVTQIADSVIDYWLSDTLLHQASVAANEVVMINQGAVQKTMSVINDLA